MSVEVGSGRGTHAAWRTVRSVVAGVCLAGFALAESDSADRGRRLTDATALRFPADLERGWMFRAHEDRCELSQTVRDYGELRFVRRAGRPLEMQLSAIRELFAPGAVRVGVRSPGWHPAHPVDRTVREQPFNGGRDLVVPDPFATEMLMALRNGLEPVVEYRGWYADTSAVAARASSVNFSAVYAAFVACFDTLMPAEWADIVRSSVHYDTDVWALTPADQARLNLVARYLDADPTVTRVFVDGHTDNSGAERHNHTLSRNRATQVADYLAGQGAAPEAVDVVVRYHGARYPVADNASPEGRSRNRRTTVRLERDPARRPVR